MTVKQKTILIDGYNLGLEKGTGVATYARNLSYEIHELGHRVSVLYGNSGGKNRDALMREVSFFDAGNERNGKVADLKRGLRALRGPAGYDAYEVPMTGRVETRTFASRLPYFDALYNANEVFKSSNGSFQIWNRSSIVNLPDQPDLAHWTYPLPIRVRGAPNLYTMHDLVPLKLPYTTLDVKQRYYKLIRLLADKADHIVTVSEHSRRDIIDLIGIPEDKVTNTYQSVSIPAKYRDKPEVEVAREVEGVTGFDYKNYFLFWGSLEPKKNIGRMIEAYMASEVATPLVIIGAQAWKAQSELALLNEFRRGASKRIVMLDYAPFSLLVSLIRGAKAALFPSLYEGFGLPALEAMLLQTPVICSNTSSLPEIAGDAAEMVDPYDTGAITRAIRRLDADADRRAELVEAGTAQAAKYSPERYRERLSAVYGKFL